MIDARCTIPRAIVRDRLSSSNTTNCFSLNLVFAAVPGIESPPNLTTEVWEKYTNS
jgi:hypothetical protein